jgi:hypothetical protein
MKAKTIGYWVTTALVAFVIGAGGVYDFMCGPDVVEMMKHLGYAPYVARLLGAWKVLGAVAILAPGLPLVKEWAYAGIVIDLTGAVVSHLASGDSPTNTVLPIVLIALTAASWALRPESRKLPGVRTALGGGAPVGPEADVPQARPVS